MSIRKTTSSHNPVLVTGIGGPAGKCATTYLMQNGCTVIGTDMRAVSSNVAHFFEVPAADDASFIPAILKIVDDFDVSLLIPTVSEELPIFARDKAAFTARDCRVMIAPYLAVHIANDKLKTARLLDQFGIAVPRTLPGNTPHSTVIETLGLPVIAKPRISRGGRGVALYTSPETLAQEQRTNIVYQEFMSGEEYDVNLFVNRQGDLQSCVVLHKTSLKEGIVGNALAVTRVQREDIVQLCHQAVKALGFTGPADIDVRLDATGTPRLLEINARLGANALSASEVLDDLMSDWESFTQLVEGTS
jgi:carbamoylphosphate synthase large subunit